MSNITNNSPVVTEEKLTEFYEDIKPFLGCPAYVTQEGDTEYYSTDEKVVGRWVDNKPLYKKTYVYKTDGSSLVPTNINTIDKIVAWEMSFGQPNNDNSWWNFINDQVAQGDGYIAYDAPNNKIGVGFRQPSWGANRTVILTIKYTKQNDSASTTVEQKPTHYSTDEQVVGTWIDGKPLYQKTIEATTFSWGSATPHGIANIKEIVNIDCVIWTNLGAYSLGRGGSIDIMVNATTSDFYINCTYTSFTSKKAILTLQYTKTTD